MDPYIVPWTMSWTVNDSLSLIPLSLPTPDYVHLNEYRQMSGH